MNELKMCNRHAEALVGHAKSERVKCLVILLKSSVHLVFNPTPLKHNTEMIDGKNKIKIKIKRRHPTSSFVQMTCNNMTPIAYKNSWKIPYQANAQ